MGNRQHRKVLYAFLLPDAQVLATSQLCTGRVAAKGLPWTFPYTLISCANAEKKV